MQLCTSATSRASFCWPLTSFGFDLGLVQHHTRWSTFPVQIVIASKRWNRSYSVFPPHWSTLMVLNKAQSNPKLVRGQQNEAMVWPAVAPMTRKLGGNRVSCPVCPGIQCTNQTTDTVHVYIGCISIWRVLKDEHKQFGNAFNAFMMNLFCKYASPRKFMCISISPSYLVMPNWN